MQIPRQYKIYGAMVAAWACVVAGQRACDSHYRQDYQQKIQQTDPNRYHRLMRETGGKYLNTWHREYLKMQDSLRTDSFYKEGYKAGQQSIRDSLSRLSKKAVKIK